MKNDKKFTVSDTFGDSFNGDSAYDELYKSKITTTGKSHKTAVLIIVTAVIFLVVMLVIGFGAYYLYMESRHNSYTEATSADNSSSSYSSRGGGGASPYGSGTVQTEPPAATQVPAPVFTFARASSVRGTDSEGGQYSDSAVLSQDPMTKWVPRKSSYNGINEWIEISAASTQYIRGLHILNGYHKNSEIWLNNNRVKDCTISFGNGRSMDCVLSDTMDMITIDFGETIAADSVRLTIRSVYSGIKWKDTAITYMGAF